MSNYRKCYEPHLRDYPDCFQECGCDECEAPLYAEKVVLSEKCGNCGTSRMVQDNYMVEKCLNCGDDEYEIGGKSHEGDSL